MLHLPTSPQRKSPRLQGYNYAQAGAYFVTICTHDRQCVFGDVTEGAMVLNTWGQIAYDDLIHIPDHWAGAVDLDVFVVMPNHLHIILVLTRTPLETSVTHDIPRDVPTLGTVVGLYKSGVTRRIRADQKQFEGSLWQGRYHDHIIRTEVDLNRIRDYVVNNPARWREDTFCV